jgi:hypothetical protein
MDMHNLIIGQEDAALLEQCLTRYVEETGVRVVLLIGRDGYLLSKVGACKDSDAESLCALAIGAFASSEALARLAGEESFNSIFHHAFGVMCISPWSANITYC